MKDIYLYDEINVMKNKLNIKNNDDLEKAESGITAIKLLNIDEVISRTFDFEHLKAIHRYIFEDIYEWAGNPRVVNMLKYEEVLPGTDGVEYSDVTNIEKESNWVINEINTFEWHKFSFDEMVENFAQKTAKLWQVHPFREGNTRTTITFMAQFAEYKGFNFNRELLKENSVYLRTALVMASIGEYSEFGYLTNILKDAMQ